MQDPRNGDDADDGTGRGRGNGDAQGRRFVLLVASAAPCDGLDPDALAAAVGLPVIAAATLFRALEYAQHGPAVSVVPTATLAGTPRPARRQLTGGGNGGHLVAVLSPGTSAHAAELELAVDSLVVEASPAAVTGAVRLALQHYCAFSADYLQALGDRLRLQRLYGRLDAAERRILKAIGRGATNREIAAETGYSEGRVKSLVRSVFNRLGVSNRTQAALVVANCVGCGGGAPD